MGAECVAGSQDAERLPILRIDLDGFLQERLGNGVVLPCDAPKMRQRASQDPMHPCCQAPCVAP